ncbi:MAG TPA: oligosaccharide flippase family protein [Solirubrobacteraceae bacterium]|jgi:O-antigen/teichoic acid export membrane protein
MAANSVRRDSIETVATGVVAQGMLVASGILVARLLGVENRGHLALMLLFPLILSISGTLGLHTAVTYYAAQGHDVRALLGVVRRPALSQFAVCLLVELVVVAVVFHNEDGSVQLAAALSVLGLPALFMLNWAQAALQGEQRFRAYNVSRLVAPLLYSIGLAAIFAAGVEKIPVVAAIWAVTMLTGCLIAFVDAVRHARAGGKPPPPLDEMKRFGLKGMVGWISPLESFQLDQLFIGLALSATDLGLYVVAAAFTNLTRLFIPQSLGVIAYPHVAGKATRAEARAAVWRFFLLAFVVCATAIAVLEVAIGTLIPLFFGDEFQDAVPLAHILLVGSLFLGLRRVLTDGTRGAGEPALGTIAEGVTAAVAIPSLIVAGTHWGPEGVAWAISGSYAVGLAAMIGMTVVVLARP